MEKNYTALRQLPRIILEKAVPLPAPLSIYIEPTNICNFRCHFCPQAFHDYKEKSGGYFSLTPDEFDHIAVEIQSLGRPQTINFYLLGEPFANKHLLYFIQESKRRNLSHRTILTTNGSLLKPEHHAPLCTSGLDHIRISIYGPDEEVHQNTTSSKTRLAKIRKNIIDLKNYRTRNNHETPHIYVKMVESADADENVRFIETFSGVGDETGLEPIVNWNDPVEGSLARLSQAELLKQKNFANKKEVCPSPFYTLVIHADLRVSACCADWNKKTVVGDLKKSSLKQIWTSDELFEFQVKHLQKRRAELPGCSQCTYLHTFPDYLDNLDAEEYIKRSRPLQAHSQERHAPES